MPMVLALSPWGTVTVRLPNSSSPSKAKPLDFINFSQEIPNYQRSNKPEELVNNQCRSLLEERITLPCLQITQPSSHAKVTVRSRTQWSNQMFHSKAMAKCQEHLMWLPLWTLKIKSNRRKLKVLRILAVSVSVQWEWWAAQVVLMRR